MASLRRAMSRSVAGTLRTSAAMEMFGASRKVVFMARRSDAIHLAEMFGASRKVVPMARRSDAIHLAFWAFGADFAWRGGATPSTRVFASRADGGGFTVADRRFWRRDLGGLEKGWNTFLTSRR